MLFLFLLLLVIIDLLYSVSDPVMLKSNEGDVQISPDFTSMKIAFKKNNVTDHVSLDADILHKSIMNFGQLSVGTLRKLMRNECLDMMAYGTSVTCGNNDNKDAEDRPRSARDAWPHRLQNYMNNFLPSCQRDGQPSQHRFIRVHCACAPVHKAGPVADDFPHFKSVPTICESSPRSDFWLENILINRPIHTSTSEIDLNQTDIVFVEAMDDFDYPFTGGDCVRHVGKETERFIQVIRKHKSEPSMIYLGASIQYAGRLGRLPSTVAQRTAIEQFDGVFDQLPVAKHYFVPYISAVDAYCPLADDAAKQAWVDMFLCDERVHPSRTGHKIIALLLLYYFNKVQLSLESPVNINLNYTMISNLTLLHFTPQQFKEYVEELHHQPLTITLNSFEHLRFPYTNGISHAWSDEYEVLGQTDRHIISTMKYKHGKYGSNAFWSDKVGGDPFKMWFRADTLGFHFHKRHVRVALGKAHTNMGTVQIHVRLNEKIISELAIDCLLPKPKESSDTEVNSPEGSEVEAEADFAWHSVDIHITSNFDINVKSIMTISFAVVESKPKREHNMIKLASVIIS